MLYTVGLSHIDRPGRPDFGWFLGRFGVLVFFVHTSLVLMMSLDRIELSKRPLFSAFYIRRFFRIYPLAMVCVALIVIFHLPQSTHVNWFNPDWSTIWANFFLCTNLFYKGNITSVLWTLPLEVQMYVLLPILYLIGKKYRLRGMALVWLAGVAAAYIQPHIAGRLTIASYVPCFVAGVISYFVGFGSVRRRLPFIGWPVAIVAAASIFFVFGSGSRYEAAWAMCLAIGLAAPLFADLKPSLLQKTSAWVARYSYGIYLTHMYALWAALVVLKDQPLWLRCGVLIVLSVGLPVLFYKLVEAPMIKLGSRLANRLPESSGIPFWQQRLEDATLFPRPVVALSAAEAPGNSASFPSEYVQQSESGIPTA